MSRFHVHIAVADLQQNVEFYSALFGMPPSLLRNDYAKWQLDDPRINFAISTRGRKPGLDHVGIQAEDADELRSIASRLEAAGIKGLPQQGTTCCYARSDKYWTTDPQGIAWEAFHTLGSAPMFGEALVLATEAGGCCTPEHSSCCA